MKGGHASTHFLEDVGVELAAGAGLPSQLDSCWPVSCRIAAAVLARCGGLTSRGVGCCGVPAESTDPAKTTGRLVIDAGSAARSPATARWQDRGDLVEEAVASRGKSHNKTMRQMRGAAAELEV